MVQGLTAVVSWEVPRREDIDLVIRERISAWVEYLKHRHRQTQTDAPLTNEQLAVKLHLAEPTVTNIINRKRTPGLDVVIAMHVRLHIEADSILDDDPPDWRRKLGERPPLPREGSSGPPVRPGKQKSGAGNH
jgi:transcriptional regulator with XRE-family HTH domain